MSAGEQFNLEFLVCGEPAPAERLELLESLGKTILNAMPGVQLRQFGYESAETGAGVRFTSWEPEIDELETNLSVTLYRDQDYDSAFMVTFQPGSRPFCMTPDLEQATEALAISDELIDFERLDPRARFVIGHMRRMVTFLACLERPEDVAEQAWDSRRDDTDIAEMLAWEMLEEKSGGSVRVKEYGFEWDDGRQLELCSHELINDLPGEQVHDSEIPKLAINYFEPDFTYCYTLGQDDERSLEVIGMNVEYALYESEEEVEDMPSLVAEFRKQIDMDDDIPRKDDVELLLKQLARLGVDDPDFSEPPAAT